jgi:hypothetical protein
VEDHPTARHPGEVAEQANPAILKPPIFSSSTFGDLPKK